MLAAFHVSSSSTTKITFKMEHAAACSMLKVLFIVHYNYSWWLGRAAGLRSRLRDRLGSAARIHTEVKMTSRVEH